MPNVDWLKIKNEYISTNISYRKLAVKNNVSFATLRNRADKEKWVELRKSQQHKHSTKLAQKTIEKLSDEQSDYLVNINKLNFELSDVISKVISQKDIIEKLRPSDIKALTGALKDIKDIQMSVDSGAEVENDGFIDALNAKAINIDWNDEGNDD